MIDPVSLWTLFASSFLASTLLPGGSEAVLALVASETSMAPAVLWGVATLGNTSGGMTSWGLGRWLAWRFPERGLQKAEHQRALAQIRRHGGPLLLLSWLPLVGDPLCLAAGWVGVSPVPSIVYMAIGKGLRYALLLLVLST